MNESINLPRLITLLSRQAECDPAVARRYLHHFFSIIEAELMRGESVTIDGIGCFVPTDDTAHPVKFLADPELAAIANEPFSAFEAIELADDVTEDELNEATEQEAHEPTKSAESQEQHESSDTSDRSDVSDLSETAETAEEVVEEVTEDSNNELPVDEASNEEEAAKAESEEDKQVDDKSEDDNSDDNTSDDNTSNDDNLQIVEPETDVEEVTQHGFSWLALILGLLIGLVIGAVGGYFYGKSMAGYEMQLEQFESYAQPTDSTSTADTTEYRPIVVATDTATTAEASTNQPDAAAKKPQRQESPATKQPVYDTVTKSRFLTTMAGEHYGNKMYWVFIYEANPSLGNPNMISPGTRILIPDKSTFAESTEAKTREKAQAHLNALSRKYKL